MRATEDWYWFEHDGFEPTLLRQSLTVAVTAHDGEHVHRYAGKVELNYDCGPCEMNAVAVVFLRAPQRVVDRVASTLRAVGAGPDNFYALLDGAESSAICGRALRDEVSKLIGVGPDCARAFGIPHSIAAAERRLKLREELLREGKLAS